MKKKLCLFLAIGITWNCLAQIEFTEQIINTSVIDAVTLYPADIDGDGDLDVVTAGFGSSSDVSWFENVGGQGSFDIEHIISSEIIHKYEVYAVDIDGDLDLDVLVAYGSKLAWFENIDSQGDFGIEQIIIEGFPGGTSSTFPADVDNDGDLDIFYSYASANSKIGWFENTDGFGTFGPEQLIVNDSGGSNQLFGVDIDGDGDVDLLTPLLFLNQIVWFENTNGAGEFSAPQIITSNAGQATSVYAGDVDGDNDMDVFSASFTDNKIAWYKNLNGLGNFGDQIIISTDAVDARYVSGADLDQDGDLDVLSASSADDKLAWYENENGLGMFGEQKIITIARDEPRMLLAADIDMDTDLDILSASSNDHTIAWYENQTVLGVSDFNDNDIMIVPVPAKEFFSVISNESIVEIKIYNNLGQLVDYTEGQTTIKIQNLKNGFYLIQIKNSIGEFYYKRIVKD